ncbi:hypothetical protein [Mycoplasmopsis arginini]|uniref:hypothetical protein n=1 Tax=Mycoplasmopsis arginini TaxID=2094 RepID=UPI003CFCD02F
MSIETLETKIKNWIATIAGVVDFKELDSKNGINFPNSGLIVEKNEKHKNGVNLTIGLIIIVNLNAKIIVEEIYQIVNYQLKKENLKLSKLCIYIKGIK